MFASMLFADEDDVRDFDRQVEALMRAGRVGEAAAIVEAALGELAREGQAVAELCLASRFEDIDLAGWDRLAERLAGLDEGGKPITALGIDIGWPGQAGHEPDAAERLEPRLETNYYSDAAFPFSTSAREALLGGYGESGALWTGGFEDIDTLVELRGLGQVHGAVAPLVERMRDLPGDDPLEADAMRLGAMFVAVRVHQAVRRTIAKKAFPIAARSVKVMPAKLGPEAGLVGAAALALSQP